MADATLTLDQTELDFGFVPAGNSATITVNFSVTGVYGDSIDVRSILTPADVSPSDTSFTITTEEGKAVVFTYSPSAPGALSGTCIIDSDADNPHLDLPVSGFGTSIAVTPTSQVFPDTQAGSSSSQILFTIQNTDPSGSLTVTAISLPAQFGQGSTWPSLPLTIAASGSAQFGVIFSPASTGVFSGNISVTSNGSSGPILIPISGSAIPALIVGYQLPYFVSNNGLVAAKAIPLSSIAISGAASNGGLSGGLSILAMPVFNIGTSTYPIAVQDFTDLLTDQAQCVIVFPSNDTPELRPATIKKIILTCFNLGPAILQCTIFGFANGLYQATTTTITIPYDSTQKADFVVQASADLDFTLNLPTLMLSGSSESQYPFGIIKAKLITTLNQDILI